MQFKQYPSYKPSGVEWLGDVPEHWRISSLKRYGYFKGGAGFPHAYQGNTEENIPFFKVNSLSKDKRFLSSFSDFVGEETAKKLGAKIFPKNSIFFAKVGAALLLERIRTNQQPCCIDNNMMGFVIQNELSFDFAFYLMSLIDFKYLVNPGAVPSINESQISSFLISVPPISEQTQIANYLDTETTRIDNLIAKQEKLIELLEEQRKSIISHAVTKGLNPNAPMKDSGVEWLGEVPEHWDVAVVKRAFIVKLGKMLQPDQKDETDVIKKYLKASNLTWDGVKDIDNEMWFSKNDLKKLKLEIGDLLVAEGGDVGKSCIFDSNEEFYYQNSVNRVRGQKNNANKFLYYWLFTLKYSGYIDILCNKSTIAHFTAEKLNETILLLPDSVEQNEIIAYLERENGKINQLILKQQSLIEKLKEYRASIISHAVTGKIDVMEFGA